MEKFLEFDKGRKDYTITTRCQYALLEKIEQLSDGNTSEYVRHVLISHVRTQIEKNNPRLAKG